MPRDEKGRFVKIDMRTGEIPGQPGKCWPAWCRIEQGIFECTECLRGPCLLPMPYVRAFEEAEKGGDRNANGRVLLGAKEE
jgi:hypothetical protein